MFYVTGDLNVPAATGKLKNPTSLDRTFFGIFKKLFDIMDPLTILSLKQSYEAIFDAGNNNYLLEKCTEIKYYVNMNVREILILFL